MTVLSTRHPLLYALRVAELRLERRLSDARARTRFARLQTPDLLPIVVLHHSSLLRRRLGTTDPRLQETKIANLRLAVATLDRLVIAPGETFSFWQRVGPPSARRGYREGLVLVRGQPAAGVGGGLCQLSNLVHWMVLHTPLEVAERHHHSVDAFADDRRALPFGTGASVFYNYVDLRVRNSTAQSFQLEIWLTDDKLHGRIRTTQPLDEAFHVFEVGDHFERIEHGVVRCNEVWRRRMDRHTGRVLADECLMRNRSPVGYPVDDALIEAPHADQGNTVSQ